jgi:truncated hemoglobin YjbI
MTDLQAILTTWNRARNAERNVVDSAFPALAEVVEAASHAVATAGPSFYDRIGGLVAVEIIVDKLHARWRGDTGLAHYVAYVYGRMGQDEFKAHTVDVLVEILGGPGRMHDLAAKHEGLGITNDDYPHLLGWHLWSAMIEQGWPHDVQAHVLAVCAKVRPAIVQSRPGAAG